MAELSFIPVDHDPFAAPAQSGSRLVPVDHDPFAAPSGSDGPMGPAMPEMGVAQAIGRGAAQGASFGFADEAAAAAAASPLPGERPKLAIPNALDTIAGGARLLAEKVAPSIFGTRGGDAYDQELAAQRALNRQAERDAPISYFGGQIAGGVALPLGTIRNARQGATVGAATGALAGVGGGEDLSSRASGAAIGAGLGGVIGAAAGGLAGRFARQPAAPAAPGTQAADELGIPLTAGQRTADPALLSRENAMAGGAYGDGAQRVAQEAIEVQRGEILAARDQIGQAAGRGVVDLARPADAGGIVGEAIGDFATRARAKFDAEQARLTGAVQGASDTMATRFNPRDLSRHTA